MAYLISDFLFYKYLSLETKIPVAQIQKIFDYLEQSKEDRKNYDVGICIHPQTKPFTKEELTEISNILSLLGDHARTHPDRSEINIVTNIPGTESLKEEIAQILYQIKLLEGI